ncbi:DUF3617 domain-containing protein [Frateuria soli]|uniref:DUF3617 domain-containing protein n=1 Tax=Frateuria soli TaxID=1542730 RepID=UPI001E61B780|nr:DUF3617 family protein [Frateuria soli]UGB36835.1 DUF3617 domain-containing protein [Frateuria soli]
MALRSARVLFPLILLVTGAGGTAFATEPGNLMKMTTTTRMQMPGMSMPPMSHTTTVCTSTQKPDPRRMMQGQKDCQVTDFKREGDLITYRMACTGAVTMNGEGRFEMLAGGGMRGSLHVTGNSGGREMTMDTSFEGQRVGACDYTPPAE